jgi:hypothetical protein
MRPVSIFGIDRERLIVASTSVRQSADAGNDPAAATSIARAHA